MKYLILLVLILPLPSLASFEARVAPGDGMSRVMIMLAPSPVSINAVEGTILLPEGATVSKLYTGASVVSPWIEAPTVQEGAIQFAGIIPGGFTGSARAGEGLTGSAELFSFELSGDGPLTIIDAYQYLNDGAGTKIAIASSVLKETLVAGGAFQEEDRTPPEYVDAVMDREVIEGKIALLITAFDAKSGIDRFEVQEGDGVWEVSSAVYEVKDESGLRSLSVRAYDRAGNFIETKVEGHNAPYLKLAFVFAVLIALLLVGAVLVYFKKRRR